MLSSSLDLRLVAHSDSRLISRVPPLRSSTYDILDTPSADNSLPYLTVFTGEMQTK